MVGGGLRRTLRGDADLEGVVDIVDMGLFVWENKFWAMLCEMGMGENKRKATDSAGNG